MAKKKTKLPVRKDGGCLIGQGIVICKPTTTGILGKSHFKLIGNGLVTIPAHIARCIPTLIKELPKDCPIVYQQEIAGLVRQQLCSWCDGSGWQTVNAGESVVACSNCKGDGLEGTGSKALVPQILSLGRFHHHPNPAVDFCVEVDVIGGLAADVAAGLEKKSVVLERIEKAMRFRVGGDEHAIAAKATLRKTEAALRTPKK